jgi:hypothetical protein
VLLALARFVWRAPSIMLGRPDARGESRRAAVTILRDWGPVIMIKWLFQSLETYTGVIRQTSIDEYLYRADRAPAEDAAARRAAGRPLARDAARAPLRGRALTCDQAGVGSVIAAASRSDQSFIHCVER